ncbi:MAG: FAD-dependent oxidoreductase, partial [Pseudomonadota bacterium]
MREQTAPIVVVGAGIVGVATALYLQRDGLDVTLIDRGAPGDGTSYGNAGVLASNSIVPVNAPGLWRKAPGMLRDPDGPLSLRWSYLPRLAPWLARYLRNCRPDRVEKTASALAGIVSDSLEEHQALARGTAAEAWIAPSDYVFLYTGRDAYDGDAYGWGLRKAHGYTWDELDGDALGAYDPQLGKLGTFAVRCPDHGH